VLTPPEGLADDELVSALASGWGMAVAAVTYRPVGFGSHHWEVVDDGGNRRFVTVDDLEAKSHAGFEQFHAALATACDLRDCGRTFVVAPITTHNGEPIQRAGASFAVAVYPFVDGKSFAWGEFTTPAHRKAVLDLVVAVHTAPDRASRHARADDFAIPHRAGLVGPVDGRTPEPKTTPRRGRCSSRRDGVQPNVGERTGADGRGQVGRHRLPPPVGRRARVEQPHAVRRDGVPGDVAVAEHEHVEAAEPLVAAPLTTRGGAGLVDDADRQPVEGDAGYLRQPGAQHGTVVVAVDTDNPLRPCFERVEQRDVDPVAGVDRHVGRVDRRPQRRRQVTRPFRHVRIGHDYEVHDAARA
jgi:hypothetical protein